MKTSRFCKSLPYLLSVSFAVPGAVAQTIYWTDVGSHKIQRADLGGRGVEDLVTTGVMTPVDIAIDVGAGKMYWTEAAPADFMISRANLDGTSVQLLVTGLVSPGGIALDVAAGKMYWTDLGSSKIQRANLDGSDVEDLLTIGVVFTPIEIALDVAAGKMYWTESSPADFMIQRADLDGSNVELLVTGLINPSGLALDVSVGKVYWTDIGTGKLQRADLDGSGVEDLVTMEVIEPVRITLDLTDGKIYWTEGSPADFMISRSNLDGTDVDLLITGLTSPSGIEIVAATGGQPILPVDQLRIVNSFVIVRQCGGDAFENDQAKSFDPFDSTVESAVGCSLAGGLASAGQQSEIADTSMTAFGSTYSEASAGVQNVIHALASSYFQVTFELPSTSIFALDGLLSIDATGDVIGAFAQIRLTTAGGDPILEHTLSLGPGGKPETLTIDETGSLTPGFYVLEVQASTGIDNDVPPSLVAEAAYEMLFSVATGDSDGDADVDITDFAELVGCLTGPDGTTPINCSLFDFDFDGDVDLADFGTFGLLFTGS